MTAELKDLYRDLILDHSREPRNFGKLETANRSANGINPLCGDKLHVYLDVRDGHIHASRYEGSGCAISMASASLMTETVTDLSVNDADDYFELITRRLTLPERPDPINDPRIEKLNALDGVRDYPMRIKCATLAWHALHAALHQNESTATTE